MPQLPLYHPRPERWPQFSLRGLFVVATVAALLVPCAVAEYRRRQNLEAQRRHGAIGIPLDLGEWGDLSGSPESRAAVRAEAEKSGPATH